MLTRFHSCKAEYFQYTGIALERNARATTIALKFLSSV